MDASILKIVGQVAGIGGLALGVLLIIFRNVLRKNIYQTFSKEQGYKIIRLIIVLTFAITVFGILAWIYYSTIIQKNEKPTSEIHLPSNVSSQTNSIIILSQVFQTLNLSQSIDNANKVLTQNKNECQISSEEEGEECPDRPQTTCLNCLPISFSDPQVGCSDVALVDATLNYEGRSKSEEQWRNGIIAHSGDEIYAYIYVNNGTADNNEEFDGEIIARNVLVQTEIDTRQKVLHYLEVKVKSDNTNSLIGRFKIITAENEQLEVLPSSGEIYDYCGNKFLTGINIGNNILKIGDLGNSWEDAIFIKFIIKVL